MNTLTLMPKRPGTWRQFKRYLMTFYVAHSFQWDLAGLMAMIYAIKFTRSKNRPSFVALALGSTVLSTPMVEHLRRLLLPVKEGDRDDEDVSRATSLSQVIVPRKVWTDAPYASLRKLRLSKLTQSIDIHPTLKLTNFELDNVDLSKTRITFQSVPLLTHIELSEVKNPLALFQSIPLHQITHLLSHRNEFSHGELPAIVENMPNLQSLDFSGPTMVSQSITVPRLRTLKMLKGVFEGANPLEDFKAPHITRLELETSDTLASFNAIPQFLRRSGCTLEVLKLGCSMWLGTQWKIDELDGVKTLIMEMSRTFDDDLQYLCGELRE
ncbi:hypothetical protein BDQ17DRAFT_1409018 [Cyathus striatus]|nr:hypothetical protein BDQ17DRAFT_1409018 [Cyathus striatus]